MLEPLACGSSPRLVQGADALCLSSDNGCGAAPRSGKERPFSFYGLHYGGVFLDVWVSLFPCGISSVRLWCRYCHALYYKLCKTDS